MKNYSENRFFYVAKLACEIPKLNQFCCKLGTGTKLEKLKNISKNIGLNAVCISNPVCKLQFCYKLPKLQKTQGISIRCHTHSVSKKTPSPYGRECPKGDNSSQSRVARAGSIFSVILSLEFGIQKGRANRKVLSLAEPFALLDFILCNNNGGNYA